MRSRRNLSGDAAMREFFAVNAAQDSPPKTLMESRLSRYKQMYERVEAIPRPPLS